MANGKRRGKTRVKSVEPISVWHALNQPIVEVSGEAARGIFLLTAVIMLAVWLAPYWGSTANYELGIMNYEERVAGAQTEITTTPEWYYIAEAVPGDVAGAFTEAANEVLDISDPLTQVVEFYEPGIQAVTDAWLELMADPY